jgi:hypothetical protein
VSSLEDVLLYERDTLKWYLNAAIEKFPRQIAMPSDECDAAGAPGCSQKYNLVEYRSMSAFAQKQTCAVQLAMFALGQKRTRCQFYGALGTWAETLITIFSHASRGANITFIRLSACPVVVRVNTYLPRLLIGDCFLAAEAFSEKTSNAANVTARIANHISPLDVAFSLPQISSFRPLRASSEISATPMRESRCPA